MANQKAADMERFMQDIEECPELRAKIDTNLLPDEQYINQLSAQMDKMAIENVKPSPIGEALDKGEATMAGGEKRKVVKAARKTDIGKE